ncbi:MAG TPA: hypothetical protein VM597_08540 [Gemmataceae bacterium]|jgi:hypothetical protein|nr:hypothetical protein [Gemmataceae bacterium]
MSRQWVARYRHGRYYVQHRESRTRYPADDRLHAVRLAQCLNRGADFFGAKRLTAVIFREIGDRE